MNLECPIYVYQMLSNEDLTLHGNFIFNFACAFQHSLVIDSKDIYYIGIQNSKKFGQTSAIILQDKRETDGKRNRGEKENGRHVYCVYAPWRREASRAKRCGNAKAEAARRSFAKERRYYHNNGQSHHLSLVPTLPDATASFRLDVTPARIASLLLIAATCTFTNLK